VLTALAAAAAAYRSYNVCSGVRRELNDESPDSTGGVGDEHAPTDDPARSRVERNRLVLDERLAWAGHRIGDLGEPRPELVEGSYRSARTGRLRLKSTLHRAPELEFAGSRVTAEADKIQDCMLS
jgi:hypothetical protein